MAGQIKVSNFAEVKALSSKLEAESSNASTKVQECYSTIGELSNNMKGEGVDSALTKLQSESQTLGNKLVQTMNNVVNFINQQTSQYTTINQEASSTLSGVAQKVQGTDTKKGSVDLSNLM